MAYIGNTPAENYASFLTETFTVSATANYTLSHAVTNENDIRLVINGVVQQPGSGKAYTASGTTLTLSSATVSGDVMYAVYLGRALQTVNPPAASVGSSQTAPTIITGQTAETSIATDDLILLSDTSASGALKKMTRANFVSGIGGTNTPNFSAYRSTNQTISHSTQTVVAYNVEVFDTDNAFDTSNGKFTVPSGKGGKYMFVGQTQWNSDVDFDDTYISIFVNGSIKFYGDVGRNEFYRTNRVVALLNLSAADYVEIKVVQGGGGNLDILGSSGERSYFYGYKIIE